MDNTKMSSGRDQCAPHSFSTPCALSVRPDFLSDASGPVAIRMSNDYLFRALLQKDNEALSGLICSLLHMKPDDVKSIIITNPIVLGSSVQDKEFIMDVNLLLNDNNIINLEMQVLNRHNWPERSLSYLCRAFDNLNPSEEYQKVRPVIHIGLLDFTLFPKYPEFYATYRMLNIKNHTLYSDKLSLSVLNLTCINLATEEDRFYKIDKWAAFFKADTWEEIKMIAQNNEAITKAANTIWKLSQEEEIRLQCQAREDRIRSEKDVQLYIAKQAEALAQKDKTLAEQTEIIARQNAQLNQELELKNLTLIRQIQNFAAKAISTSDCAALLGADAALVQAVYHRVQSCPEADAAQIYDFLRV